VFDGVCTTPLPTSETNILLKQITGSTSVKKHAEFSMILNDLRYLVVILSWLIQVCFKFDSREDQPGNPAPAEEKYASTAESLSV
jgi:hypothetical protein